MHIQLLEIKENMKRLKTNPPYLLEITFFCSSCLSNDANAHNAPYVATLLADSNYNINGDIKESISLVHIARCYNLWMLNSYMEN